MPDGFSVRRSIATSIAIVFALVEQPSVVIGRDSRYGHCEYSHKKQPGGVKPEVYWINLNTSLCRRKAMTKVRKSLPAQLLRSIVLTHTIPHLPRLPHFPHQLLQFLDDFGLPHFRVEAVTKNDVYIPEDLWSENYFQCRMTTSFKPSYVATPRINGTPIATINDTQVSKQPTKQYPRKFYIKGLCGRNFNRVPTDNNRRKELAVTVSHLLAIRQAVYSTTATSQYALILEDDVWTPFDIDLELLAEEARRETGLPFGFIQFLNSKRISLDELFYCFTKNRQYHCQVYYNTSRWAKRPTAEQGRFLMTWSTGAYLIDRVVMKPVIGDHPRLILRPRPLEFPPCTF